MFTQGWDHRYGGPQHSLRICTHKKWKRYYDSFDGKTSLLVSKNDPYKAFFQRWKLYKKAFWNVSKEFIFMTAVLLFFLYALRSAWYFPDICIITLIISECIF